MSAEARSGDAVAHPESAEPPVDDEVRDEGDELADEEEHWEETGRSAFMAALWTAPAWLVSLMLHMVILIVLAVCTFADLADKDKMFVSVNAVDAQDEALEELTELEMDQLQEMEEIQDIMLPTAVIDPGQIAFGDLSVETDIETQADIGEIAVGESTIDEIGALFGGDGDGFADIGEGLKAAASFFGSKSRGNSFVFVVDNSNSMTKGRFETAMNELVRTVDSMTPDQKFYVIFFSDTAYRLFHPTPASGLIPATDQNKERLKSWLYTVEMCLKTKGEEAVAAALSLNPDVVYILGDGAFTDRTTEKLIAPHNRRTPIHTVGMEVDPTGQRQLTAIANANNGTFRLVAAAPAAKMMAQKRPIRRNRIRGAVWGIDLPANLGAMAKKKKR